MPNITVIFIGNYFYDAGKSGEKSNKKNRGRSGVKGETIETT